MLIVVQRQSGTLQFLFTDVTVHVGFNLNVDSPLQNIIKGGGIISMWKAAFIPTTTMGVSNTRFIPYAFYLYLMPIFNMLLHKILEVKNEKSIKSLN